MLTQFLTDALCGAFLQERFNVAVTSTAAPPNTLTEPNATFVAVIEQL